jgi:superfamily II DNA or RNA helicase
MLPESSRGLGPTATPLRADGKGLGAHADGVADDLLIGPSMRESIQDGMLCDYKIYAPPSTLDLSKVAISAGGDFQAAPLSEAVHKSSITGDVVRHYLKIAAGKLGITFAVNLAHAAELADAYNAAGVPAIVISGDTGPLTRARIMREFKARKWLQLVNVDVLGEGVDVPACEVVSFARPTMSFGLYVQQFGRVLRLMLTGAESDGWGDLTSGERLRRIAASAKPHGIIIDHVGQWERLGLPDSPRRWTLDARERGSKSGPSDAIPLRTCLNDATGDLCLTVYPRDLPCCPVCGWVPPVANRSRPEFVDGDLFELDASVLAKLRGEADRIMAPEPYIPHGMPTVAALGLQKQHRLRRDAQTHLGELIELWAGWQRHLGHDDRAAYRRFFFAFGVDVATARTLGRPEAEKLAQDVQQVLDLNHIVKE